MEHEGAGAGLGESRCLEVQPLPPEECEGTPAPDTEVWSSRSGSDLEVAAERLSRERWCEAESKWGGLAECVTFERCGESRTELPQSLTFKEKISKKKRKSLRRPGTQKTDAVPLKQKN